VYGKRRVPLPPARMIAFANLAPLLRYFTNKFQNTID